MRNFALAASAALTMAAWASWGPAQAFETVVGGFAGQCSSNAKEGRTDAASIDVCTRAISGEVLNDHDLAGTYVNRGAMEVMNRSWDVAHQDFQAAIKIMPSLGEARIGEGAYLINMERWPEAEASISRGLELGSEEPEKGYYFRGLARWGQENFKGAYEDFHKALDLKPGWSLPKQQLAFFKVEPKS